MYNPNVDTQNYPLWALKLVIKRLNTQFNESNNQNLLKSPKIES